MSQDFPSPWLSASGHGDVWGILDEWAQLGGKGQASQDAPIPGSRQLLLSKREPG